MLKCQYIALDRIIVLVETSYLSLNLLSATEWIQWWET